MIAMYTMTKTANEIIPKNNESLPRTNDWNVSINIFGILDMIPAIISKEIPLPIPF